MSFNKLLAFTKKVADFADKPAGTPAEKKAQFDAAPEELRQNVVNLIDALKSTASGDSGAKNLGATSISGLTGTDVQTLLESLNTADGLRVKTVSSGMRIEIFSAIFFTNGSSATATTHANFGQTFTTAPYVLPANITQVQSYGNSIMYPYIHNVTTTGFDVDITAIGGNLGTAGSPGNIFMNFLIFGN